MYGCAYNRRGYSMLAGSRARRYTIAVLSERSSEANFEAKCLLSL